MVLVLCIHALLKRSLGAASGSFDLKLRQRSTIFSCPKHMASMAGRQVRIAVEGCGHGCLDNIYAAVQDEAKSRNWDKVDMLIIGGDFQAVRNASDLNCMAVPAKYKKMGDFHDYYSGKKIAPVLTIFVGGNHEASNHLFELYYGGWVAPNIYYLGAANVLRFGSLRISGLSGIWKGFDYKKPHFERLPYGADEIRSAYHVREIDARKLLNVRSQVDVGISHDWPRSIERFGDTSQLKRHLLTDSETGQLGNVAAKYVLEWLRPFHWFSAHLHCKYTAVVGHSPSRVTRETIETKQESSNNQNETEANKDEIVIDMDDVETGPVVGNHNPEEIDLGVDEFSVEEEQNATRSSLTSKEPGTEKSSDEAQTAAVSSVPTDIRSQLPEAFRKRIPSPESQLPEPEHSISNETTNFLALDKCLPNRHFLEMLEIEPLLEDPNTQRPYHLSYDPEWLSITRAFAPILHPTIGVEASTSIPPDKGRGYYAPKIAEARRWVDEHIVDKGKLEVPLNFVQVAPVFDPEDQSAWKDMPREYSNPQTQTFCDLLGIDNPFYLNDEEAIGRQVAGPRPGGQHRGGGRGRGFTRGRGRGHRGRDWTNGRGKPY